MAEPTVWGFTATAGLSTTFTIEGTNIYGVVINGAVTPKIITPAPNMQLVLTATKTLDEIATALLAWCVERGYGRSSAGGIRASDNDGTRTPTLTVTS